MPANHIDPRSLPASFITASAQDPALSWPGAPPNFGQEIVPHVATFSGRYGVSGKAYQWADEALRDSKSNAERMRTDCGIMEALEARMRATCLLNWHIVPEDEKSLDQKTLADEVTRIIRRTPQFTKLRWALSEGTWYGRAGTAQAFGSDTIGGKRRTVVRRWEPRHGDKLVFRYDDGTHEYDGDQVGIRVGAGYDIDPHTEFQGNPRRKVEATQYGLVYWLDKWERRLLAVHKHIVEDAPFEDPLRAGAIHGVGIRDRIYWTWYGMINCLQNVMIYLERAAFGIEVWYYPASNATAKTRTEEAARKVASGGRTVLVVPVMQGEDAEMYKPQFIEPGLGGIESAMMLVREYFGHKIKRYILGQTLSSEPDATGLGSGVADLQAATFADIVKFDAVNLEETITTDILRWIQLWNFPASHGIWLRFVIDTDSPAAERKMEAYSSAWNMGARIREEDVLSTIGAAVPKDDDRILLNPAFAQQQPGSCGFSLHLPPGVPVPGMNGRNGHPVQLGSMSPDRYGLRSDIQAAATVTATEPSEAQREAGNYRKGKVRLHGLTVSIENPKGSSRRPEWPPLSAHYGYINRTEGRDGDHVDCFIGPHPESEVVFVVDQETRGGRFDEHKCLLGFINEEKARAAYLANYPDGWRCGPVTAMTIDQFKAWLAHGDTTARVAGQVSRYTESEHWKGQPRDERGQWADEGAGKADPKEGSPISPRKTLVVQSEQPKQPANFGGSPKSAVGAAVSKILSADSDFLDGAPVTPKDLMKSSGLSPEELQTEVLKLAAEGKVYLSHFDLAPASIPDAYKLIFNPKARDGEGGYVTYLSVRDAEAFRDAYSALLALDVESRERYEKRFDESEHPRGQPDNAGQFAEKEGAAKPNKASKSKVAKPKAKPKADKAAKQAESDRKFEELMAGKTPEDQQAFRAARADGIAIPPAWTEVVYHGKDQPIRAEGRDEKGRKQRAEDPQYRQRISDENNARIAKPASGLPGQSTCPGISR